MATKKITITLTESLIQMIDEYAAELHIKRSPAISVLISQAVDARKNMAILKDVMKLAQTTEGTALPELMKQAAEGRV